MALALGAGMLGALAGLQARDDRYVAGRWRTLEQAAGAGGVFTEERLVGLPDAARRYFRMPSGWEPHWRRASIGGTRAA